MITRIMDLLYPSSVKASHINMIRGAAPTFKSHPLLDLRHALTPYSQRDHAGFERSDWFLRPDSGYRNEQSTKPQTLGYALNDSPVGLLAWVYEKLHDWTDSYSWTDEILTGCRYTGTPPAGPTASLRIYYESAHDDQLGRARTEHYIPQVKLELAHFSKETSVVPHAWGRTMRPVVF